MTIDMAAAVEDARADVIVTEIFDTELIGEGVLGTLHHALRDLARGPATTVIPAAATVYAQLVQSDVLRQWQHLEQLPVAAAGCPGRAPVDVHAERLAGSVTVLTEPAAVLQIDFARPPAPPFLGQRSIELRGVAAGRADAAIVWWTLHLDSETNLSTAPPWARAADDPGQWRDHWLQAVHLLPVPVDVAPEALIQGSAHHDEYTIWLRFPPSRSPEPPACTCGAHVLWNKDRFWALNDAARTDAYTHLLQPLLSSLPPTSVAVKFVVPRKRKEEEEKKMKKKGKEREEKRREEGKEKRENKKEVWRKKKAGPRSSFLLSFFLFFSVWFLFSF